MATSRRSMRSTSAVASPPRYRTSDVLVAPSFEATEVVYAPLGTGLYEVAKRAVDITAALAGIIVTLPLLALIALLIRIDSSGPVLFRQERLGKDARPFTMLKFRSMYVNADAMVQQLMAQNESSGPLFKMKADPRVTRVGKYLRRTSLDELPQLFNILFGQMSIVGPRPPLPREMAGFEQQQRARLRITPGLTGLWQISGRSELSFDDMVRLDLHYIERRSLLFDIVIILKTVPSVLRGHGAY